MQNSKMKFFDSHEHYNDEKFNVDRDKIINEIFNDEIKKIICAGYNLPSSKQALEIAQKYKNIYSIIGISPNDVINNKKDLYNQLSQIEKLAENKKVVAIGEIGLDYHWNTENKNIQKETFIKQIDLANKLKLPIVIHTREAVNDTLQILKENEVIKKGVFHCCPLNIELIKEALNLGYYISLAGPITFKNSKNANLIIDSLPLEKILIETDSPYLSPEPFRGKRNDSRNLKLIAEKISKVKQKTLKEISEITYKNTCRIFEINEEI